MGLKIGERDILGYAGLVLIFLALWTLWGFWIGVGIIGCFLFALGGEKR